MQRPAPSHPSRQGGRDASLVLPFAAQKPDRASTRPLRHIAPEGAQALFGLLEDHSNRRPQGISTVLFAACYMRDYALRHRILHAYVSFALRRPLVPLGVVGALTLASALLIPHLSIVTARSKQARADHPHIASVARFVEEFGGLETGVVVASSDDAAATRAYLDALSTALSAQRDHIGAVFHKLDPGPLRDKAAFYAPLGLLEGVAKALARPELAAAKLARIVSLESALTFAAERLDVALEEGSGQTAVPADKMKPALEGARRFFVELQRWLSDPKRTALGFIEGAAESELGVSHRGTDAKGYLGGKDGRTYMLFVYPRTADDSNEAMIAFTERVRKTVAEVKASFLAQRGGTPADLDVGMTGIPASIADEFTTIAADMTLISLVSFFGIALLMLLSYGFSIRILIALAPIALGTLWTFGFASVAIGHLTLLSSIFSAVLFGLGDDFGIHLLARFEEEWAKSDDARAAATVAIVETGPGVITGAATTATAFFTTLLVEMDAFSELGLVTGTGLLLVALCAFLIMPPMFLWWARLRAKGYRFARVLPTSKSGSLFQRFVGGRLLRFPKLVVLVGVAATVVFFLQARGIPYDYDYLNMLPPGVESTRYQLRLVNTSDFTPEFNASAASTLRELEDKVAALSKLGSVSRVESVAPLSKLARRIAGDDAPASNRAAASRAEALAPFIPNAQEAKLSHLRAMKPHVDALSAPPKTRPPLDLRALRAAFTALIDKGERLLEAAPSSLTADVSALLKALYTTQKMLDAPTAAARIGAFEAELFNALGEGLAVLKSGVKQREIVGTADLEAAGRGVLPRFVSERGRYAIYAFPSGPIWNRAFLTKFVEETRSVDPAMTGFPAGFHYFSQAIQDGFKKAALYAALAILILLLLEFRNLTMALLAAVPLCIGAATMLGLMAIFGIKYNPANIVGLPLVLGMGVEYGVETVHRFAESKGLDVEGVLTTTARAILLAGTTTLLGLGSMILAAHMGLSTLGLILVFGIGGCLVASVLILPALLILVARARRARARQDV